MRTLIFIRDRILSRAPIAAPTATVVQYGSASSIPTGQIAYSSSSVRSLEAVPCRLSGADHLAAATGLGACHGPVAYANGQRSSAGALTSLFTQRIDSGIAG